MKLVLIVVDGMKLTHIIAAPLYLRIHASFAQMVPLLVIILSHTR